MSDYKITDLVVPNPGFDRNNPGENSVKRGDGPPILTKEQEDQAERDRAAKRRVHAVNMETYAAMIAHKPAQRKE